MLNLNLHIEPKTQERLKKILDYSSDQETFAQNIIAWQIAELKKGILNIRIDIKQFEKKYAMDTKLFYEKFESGKMGDEDDYMIWSGIYEMQLNCKQKLQKLL